MFNDSNLPYETYATRTDREFRQAIAATLMSFISALATGFACLLLIAVLGCFCLSIFRLSNLRHQNTDDTEPFAIFHPEFFAADDADAAEDENNGQRRQLG